MCWYGQDDAARAAKQLADAAAAHNKIVADLESELSAKSDGLRNVQGHMRESEEEKKELQAIVESLKEQSKGAEQQVHAMQAAIESLERQSRVRSHHQSPSVIISHNFLQILLFASVKDCDFCSAMKSRNAKKSWFWSAFATFKIRRLLMPSDDPSK